MIKPSCPKCGSYGLAIERSPDGRFKCLACEYSGPNRELNAEPEKPKPDPTLFKTTKHVSVPALRSWFEEGSPRPVAVSLEDKTLRDANGEIIATFHSEADLMFAGTAFNGYLTVTEEFERVAERVKDFAKQLNGGGE